MRQEVSVSYEAVKRRVYRLIDSLAEEGKTTNDVKESLKRWWKHDTSERPSRGAKIPNCCTSGINGWY
jgi:hypothetical protein